MSTGFESIRPFVFARRIAAFAIFAGASTLGIHAQQTAPEPVVPAKLIADASVRPLDLASVAGVNYSSSSESSSLSGVEATGAERLNLSLASTQPPPRRRYGRPRYNDSSHNPDGSNKYAFAVGAGLTAPNGNTYKYLNTNYAFQVGAGRNFNKTFALMAQFDYDRFGFNGQTINNQETLYNYCPPNVSAANCNQIANLDGNSHVWSFSLNPVVNFYSSEGLGAYFVVGAGFYHKTANFTVPVTGQYCDPYGYYGCYQYQANQTIDKYTSNAPGFNGGLGLTFKPSRFAGEKFFVEGRYVFVDNSKRTGITVYSPVATLNTYAGNNFYPQNSNRTSYSVFKAGVRF